MVWSLDASTWRSTVAVLSEGWMGHCYHPPTNPNTKILAFIQHAQNKIQFKRPATAKHVCSHTHTHAHTQTQVHAHTYTQTLKLTDCGTHSFLPLCWRCTRVFWVGVFRHKLPYCQRKNKINRYKAETGWSAAAVYCTDSCTSSTVITVSCCSVLH